MKPKFSAAALAFSLIALHATGEAAVTNIAGSPPHAWTAAAPSVALETDGENGASIRVTVSASTSDTLAVSPVLPLEGFRKYRLTARIKTTYARPRHIVPMLACECLLHDAAGSLGSFRAVSGDVTAEGAHRVSVEFRAPWGTEACRLLLVAGGDGEPEPGREPYSADIAVDGVTLEPIEAYTAGYALDPFPERLSEYRSVHPRLYLTDRLIDGLRRKTGSTHADIWMKVRAQADGFSAAEPPAYRGNDRGEYDEQWWQSRNGLAMATLAFAFRMTGDAAYLDAAEKWALTTCRYPHWGVGWIDGMDCMTGHHLFGLALVYDWCYRDLESPVREEIRDTLIRRGTAMFEAASRGAIVPDAGEFSVRPWPEWEEAYLQNHLWVNSSGLAAAGFALFDEHDDAASWIAFTAEKFGKTAALLGPDGASHEGINYWSYGLEHLLKYLHLSRGLLGVDLFDNDWFRHTATYRLYTGIPRNGWERGSTTVDYADSHRRDHSGPDFLLRSLAAEYRNGYAQWLANTLDEADVQLPSWKLFNLLWYDPSVEPVPPSALPTMRHFTDMDFVSMRSDWSGDASLVFFKCGPYIGHKAIRGMPYCTSSAHHTHPDQNHFVIHGAGEWLIRDDGNMGKYTGQHNTLLIDGGEQLGGGDSIFDGRVLYTARSTPRIVKASHSDELDHTVGDAAAAYPRGAGLERFRRHLLFLKPDVLIVIDDIELTEAHDLELRFHPERQTIEKEGNTLVAVGEKARLHVTALTPESVDISTGELPLVDRRYNRSAFLTIRMRHRGAAWRNAVAFSWSEKPARPKAVTFEDNGARWTFGAGSKTVRFDWTTGEAELIR